MLNEISKCGMGRLEPQFSQVVVAQDSECQFLLKEKANGVVEFHIWAFKNKPTLRKWGKNKLANWNADGQVVVDYNPPTEHSPTAEFGLMISMSPQSQMSENDMMDLIKKIWGKIVSEKLMLERSLIKNVG